MAEPAEACIVCLGDLKSAQDQPPSPASDASATSRRSPLTRNTTDADDERIAHLLPCKHSLHNGCLKPWVERANSCPICRALFNQVELKEYLDGPTIDSYAVQDKTQQAELDPSLTIDDTIFEDQEPCLICGTINDNYEVMFCDGCDRTVHIYCSNEHNDVPDVWYCQDCLLVISRNGNLPNAGGPGHPTRRAPANRISQPRRRRTRRPNSDWARVWQSVWDNLNLDLDFPFDDEAPESRRTPAQRREFSAWQRRLRIANQHGAASRFRETATALLDTAPPPPPESQEELRAWNAFDKARELQETNPTNNRRKRASTTASPASPGENGEPERRLKRPRTRRNLAAQGSSALAESSTRAVQRADAPSFLTSLLHEVENQPTPNTHASPGQSSAADELWPLSSPDGSPVMTAQQTPRGVSVTPPPLMLSRTSITPLTSIVRPLPSSPTGAFSPFSPADPDKLERQPRRRTIPEQTLARRDQSPQSPSHNLSYSTKSEIQRMVKNALGTLYKDSKITKDQYTDINRDVSRMLYEHVDDVSDLADYDSRNRLQKLATDEVQKAVDALQTDV